MTEKRNVIFKTLFLGPINGNFADLYTTLNNLNKNHGPFEAAFCAGQIFNTENSESPQLSYDHNEKSSIPIYVLGPNSNNDEKYYQNIDMIKGGEILPNVMYMGRAGISVLQSGLTVAYISKSRMSDGTWNISEDNINHLLTIASKTSNFKGVDFLITPVWPRDILNGVAIEEKLKQALMIGDSRICKLARILKPRYHLADMNLKDSYFYERQPYKNHTTGDRTLQHITRFVNLAAFDNQKKNKWLYAIKISPISVMAYEQLTIQPDDVTENPYLLTQQENSISENTKTSNNTVSNSGISEPSENITISNIDIQKTRTPDCWFCLSNPNLEKHLIVHVANHNYLALAKGGLVPYHVLICPITHYSCLVSLDQETYAELQSFKDALAKMFSKENMSIVVFDRNYHSQHLQLQVVPMRKQNPRFLCQAFIDHGKKCNMDFVELQPNVSLFTVVSPSTPYFYVEFEDGIRILHIIKGKIPIQFAREVLASSYVLALGPDRVDWKKCQLGYNRESTLTKELTAKFNAFNSTI